MATRLHVGLLSLLALGLGACSTYRASVLAGYTQSRLRGDMGVAPTATPSTVSSRVDLADSLGLDDAGSPWVRVELGAGPLGFTASGYRYDDRGTGNLTAPFGDLPAGLAVRSDIEIVKIKGALTYDVLDVGPVRLSPGVAVDWLDIDAEVHAVNVNAAELIEIRVPAPLLFVQGELDLGPVAATVDVGGMAVDIDDVDGTYFDVEGLLRARPLPNVEVFAGYHWLSVEAEGIADGQAYDTTLRLSGWVIGGGVKF